MKLDKRKPLHWLLLIAFAIQAGVGLLMRVARHRRRSGIVVLYGHKLNGNLLAIYRCLEKNGDGMRPVFLSMDTAYCNELNAADIRCQRATGAGCARLLAVADALISDHGLHALQPFHPIYRRLGLRFFDAWHGIPFKGFDADDFRLQHNYDEVWVASESQRDLWIEKFGFNPKIVHATGYARTDQLVIRTLEDGEAKHRLGLDPAACGKTILFAPTWAQDNKGHSIYPFGCSEQEFLGALSTFADRHGATILLRSHLNTGTATKRTYSNVITLPSTHYPDTEAILLASDMLVCDWSSIAFDFLLLDRPTIFLDVPPPFRKGFSLGPEHRFGDVTKNLPDLLRALEYYAMQPSIYWMAHGATHQSARNYIYGNKADGHSTIRCIARLQLHTKPS